MDDFVIRERIHPMTGKTEPLPVPMVEVVSWVCPACTRTFEYDGVPGVKICPDCGQMASVDPGDQLGRERLTRTEESTARRLLEWWETDDDGAGNPDGPAAAGNGSVSSD